MHAEKAIAKRMIERNLRRTQIEPLSRALNRENPDVYHTISSGHIYAIVRPGYFVGIDKPAPSTVNTLIKILWDGDVERYAHDVGLNEAPWFYGLGVDKGVVAGVPHYLEGEAVLKQKHRRITPQFLHTDVVLTHQRESGLPLFRPGQMSGFSAGEPEAGDYALVSSRLGVGVAAKTKEGKFETPDGESIKIKNKKDILGVMLWTQPRAH